VFAQVRRRVSQDQEGRVPVSVPLRPWPRPLLAFRSARSVRVGGPASAGRASVVVYATSKPSSAKTNAPVPTSGSEPTCSDCG